MCVPRYIVGVNYIFNKETRVCWDQGEGPRTTVQYLEGIGKFFSKGRGGEPKKRLLHLDCELGLNPD